MKKLIFSCSLGHLCIIGFRTFENYSRLDVLTYLFGAFGDRNDTKYKNTLRISVRVIRIHEEASSLQEKASLCRFSYLHRQNEIFGLVE